MIWRLPYTLLLHLLLPLIVLRLWLRARRQRGYLDHVGERFGRFDLAIAPPLIWVHAVSVGETQAARPLIEQLLARYPDHQILLTHMTVTGRATSGALFADEPRVHRAYLPYDFPWAVRAFLTRFKPRLGIILETELWPNLFAAASARGIPLVLANARLSEKSARGYRRVAPLVKDALRHLRLVAAQSTADASRLEALGARGVAVMGNVKFDAHPPADKLALGALFKSRIGDRKVLLAASTREGEEPAILDACAKLPDAVLLVIVPRHPERFEAVAAEIAARGLAFQRRSSDQPIAAQTRVLLGDSMGEMFAYYSAADVAFVGGSLACLGGQNLIEACSVGTPVLVGPHTFNFEEVTREAIAAGAAKRIRDADQLASLALEILCDDTAREGMSAAGRHFAEIHRGATHRLMSALENLLSRG
ncbi:MAG: hypothetical protein RIR70_721 [Pseudomonadota bacterium]|jgi:3-deoxy-D-manno-octulosonic-acid transferase